MKAEILWVTECRRDPSDAQDRKASAMDDIAPFQLVHFRRVAADHHGLKLTVLKARTGARETHMVLEEKVIRYKCSDGESFDDKLDAEVHEAELGVIAVCNEHGYSAPSFSRELLASLLFEHFRAFRDALDAYCQAVAARAAVRLPASVAVQPGTDLGAELFARSQNG